MRWRVAIAVIILTLASTVGSAAEWVYFRKVDLGYVDRRGASIPDISPRQNRFPRDSFWHKGTLYPDLSSLKVVERYEGSDGIVVLCDVDPTKAAEVVTSKALIDPSISYVMKSVDGRIVPVPVRKEYFDFSVFKARVLTEAEASAIVKGWGYLPAKSGVTP